MSNSETISRDIWPNDPRIAEGEIIATLAHTGPSESIEVGFRPEGDGYALSGVADFVVDGHTADLLIVAAEEAESGGELALFTVPGDAPGGAVIR